MEKDKDNISKKIKTYKLLISGRVQGVGFRYFAQDNAEILGICGYVKNTFDDKVEIIWQSDDPTKLKLFIEQMKKGPTFSYVKEFFVQEFECDKLYDSFTIRF